MRRISRVMILAVLFAALLGQTATPSPTALACQAEAGLTRAEAPADFHPPEDGGPLNANVLVLISPEGKVEKATLAKSSGNLEFDWASVVAARRSAYKPKIVDCKPVEGTFIFKTSLAPYP